ncbi:hypothetical protein [Actinomadura viridis]|uniref:Uncharacterized protein n=1 Tax=Actinomadura viridis TaxID=58110 RepID=A0A931DHJ7_9ACTN|nr:hypothetical protein [Actinomadura viridis]MBG6090190.1 hypothetical protein [Actinomadura viridis]
MTTPRLPRDDLAAALAARRELGPDYDDAFVETLAARIEATLAARAAAPAGGRLPAGTLRSRSERNSALALAIVSLVAAIPLSAIGAVNAGVPGLVITWAAIVLVNLIHGLRSR